MDGPTMEKFCASECINADTWINRFEHFCAFKNWNDVQITRGIVSFFDDAALAWYMMLDDEDRKCPEKLFAKFRQRFGMTDHEKIGEWKKCNQINQQENESVSQYISRLEKQCYRSEQKFLFQHFLARGLRKDITDPYIHGIVSKANPTIDEVIHAAKIAEATVKSCALENEKQPNPEVQQIEVTQAGPIPNSSEYDSNWQECEYLQYAHNLPYINVLNKKSNVKPKRLNNFRQNTKFYRNNSHVKHNFHEKKRNVRISTHSSNIPNLFVQNTDHQNNLNNCKIKIRISKQVFSTLVDTGASVSVMNEETFKKLNNQFPLQKSKLPMVRGVNGNVIRVLGNVTLPIEIGKLTVFQDFCVLDYINVPIILGRDFMLEQNAEISFPKQILSLQNGMTEVPLHLSDNIEEGNNFVHTISQITLEPRQRIVIPVKIENVPNSSTGVIEPNFSLIGKYNIIGTLFN